MLRRRPSPEQVFTPRASDINDEMYIKRANLEFRLAQALDGQKIIVLHGESGNGKTWLYKKVFKDRDVHYATVNLASAVVSGDVSAAIEEKLPALGRKADAHTEVTWVAGARPSGIGVERTKKKIRKPFARSTWHELLAALREKAGNRIAVAVMENFEQISHDEKLLRQLGGLLVMVDDENLAQLKVKILIVGVPVDIRAIISRSTNAVTIANRLIELPEIARLTQDQSADLLRRGFEKLGITFAVDRDKALKELAWKSDRIAQHVQEIGLAVAREAMRTSSVVTHDVISTAEKEWISDSLSADYSVIELLMNSRQTRTGRKNQVLYALGLCASEDFRTSDIEKIVRKEFPKGMEDISLNIGGILAEFATGASPIIRRTPKGDAYRFVSPKYRISLRTALRKKETGEVTRLLDAS